MAAYLVRHAHAGDRTKWEGPDDLRPLSPKGHGQAAALADLLAGRRIGLIVASPALRCMQTVEPLAARLELAVETEDALAEGAAEQEALALVRKLASEDPTLCTHGDVIPKVLDALAREDGLAIPDAYPCAKGSVWVLDQGDDGRFSSAEYLPAP